MSDIQDEEPRKIGLLVLQPFCSNFFHQDLRRCHQGVVGVIDDKARGSASSLFNMLSLNIINFYLVIVPAFGVIGSQSAGLFKNTIWEFLAFCFYDYVGTWDPFGVEPPVVT